jgi:hypothetical protein
MTETIKTSSKFIEFTLALTTYRIDNQGHVKYRSYKSNKQWTSAKLYDTKEHLTIESWKSKTDNTTVHNAYNTWKKWNKLKHYSNND